MKRFAFSEVARATVRPMRTYAALGARGPQNGDARAALYGALFTLFVVSAFVSWTAAGRLVVSHLVWTVVFWSFLPLVQLGALAFALRIVARDRSLAFAARLYFAGHGPWIAFMLAVSGVCLFTRDVYAVMMRLLTLGILPGALLLSFVWGGVLTWATFRRGLALARGPATAATALYYFAFVSAIVGYYYATDQIRPQFFGVPS